MNQEIINAIQNLTRVLERYNLPNNMQTNNNSMVPPPLNTTAAALESLDQETKIIIPKTNSIKIVMS